jgi:hypothetical protein
LGSIELTASKVAGDNARLRTLVVEGDGKGKDEEIVELKVLLQEYKAQNKELLGQLEAERGMRVVEGLMVGEGGLNGTVKAREEVLLHRTKHLEKAVQKRDDEIRHLQNLLGERVVSTYSNTSTRLIYLEEHCRKLEEVLHILHVLT